VLAAAPTTALAANTNLQQYKIPTQVPIRVSAHITKDTIIYDSVFCECILRSVLEVYFHLLILIRRNCVESKIITKSLREK
jgi:hypothetical protein